MTEAVGSRGLSLGYEGTVSVVDTLRYSYDNIVVLLPQCGNVFQELVHVEVNFRQVNQISRIASNGSQGSSAC